MTGWLNVPDSIDDFVGFVYVIEHPRTGRYYIGQKVFWNKRRRKPLKGRKRSRIDRVESDWRKYWGSSEALRLAVKGRECEFCRTILRCCRSKAEMNYWETKLQFDRGVLFDPDSWNNIINCRISRNQVNSK